MYLGFCLCFVAFWFLSVDLPLAFMVQPNSHRRIFVVGGEGTQVHQRIWLPRLCMFSTVVGHSTKCGVLKK